MKARYYDVLGNGIQCTLCPVGCHISEGSAGRCGVRRMVNGILTTQYGQVAALALDPMEKKPLYHFFPGRSVLSAGGYGCNLHCSFCQNWALAQGTGSAEQLLPEQLVDLAEGSGAAAIAFTYNEPLIQPEYILDTAPLARKKGIRIVLVTNGYIQPCPLADLLPWVDAMNIDIKGTEDAFYREYCGGRLAPVLSTVAAAFKSCHVEITTLVIGGVNDEAKAMEAYFAELAALSPDLPLHLTRYYPAHRMTLPPTPPQTLFRLAESARRHLNYVYIGNLPGADRNTICPECGTILIRREKTVELYAMQGPFCTNCGNGVPITIQPE